MKVGRGVNSQFVDILFTEKVLEIQMVADLRGVGVKYWENLSTSFMNFMDFM